MDLLFPVTCINGHAYTDNTVQYRAIHTIRTNSHGLQLCWSWHRGVLPVFAETPALFFFHTQSSYISDKSVLYICFQSLYSALMLASIQSCSWRRKRCNKAREMTTKPRWKKNLDPRCSRQKQRMEQQSVTHTHVIQSFSTVCLQRNVQPGWLVLLNDICCKPITSFGHHISKVDQLWNKDGCTEGLVVYIFLKAFHRKEQDGEE